MVERSTTRVRRMRIFNFQPLEDVSLELGNLTVIRGPSDVGKSSVVRAFRAVVLNKLGKEQVRTGATFSRVSVELDTGEVSIIRDGKDLKNVRYEVTPTNGETIKHLNCNKEVPKQAVDILGIRPFVLDESVEVLPGIASQFGGQFPLDQPATVISKLLGRISNLHVVFSALRLLDEDDRENTSNLSATEKLVELKQAAVDQFKELPIRKEALAVLVEADSLEEAASSGRDQSRQLHGDLRSLSQQSEALEAQERAAAGLLRAAQLWETERARLEEAKGLLAELSFDRRTLTALEDSARAAAVVESCHLPDASVVEAASLLRDLRTLARQLDLETPALAAAQNLAERFPEVLLPPIAARELHAELQTIRTSHNQEVRVVKEKMAEAETLAKELQAVLDSLDVCPIIKDTWRDGCKERLVTLG